MFKKEEDISIAKAVYHGLGSVLILFAAIIGLSACACPKHPGPLSSDRPGQATSPNLVPPCHPQLELGWTHTENKDDNDTLTKSDQVPNTLLRIGVIPNGEVRISIFDEPNAGVSKTSPSIYLKIVDRPEKL